MNEVEVDFIVALIMGWVDRQINWKSQITLGSLTNPNKLESISISISENMYKNTQRAAYFEK